MIAYKQLILLYIKNAKTSQLKKTAVESGLLAIKGLKIFGRLIAAIFRLIAGFFRLFSKLLLHPLLTKAYFEAFRFRKHTLKNRTSFQFLKNNAAYIALAILSFLFITANLQDHGTANAQISKTVMANLVQNQFSYLDSEDLIEETYTPGSLKTAGQEKYYSDDLAIIQKQSGITQAEDVSDNSLILINDEAVAVKPRTIGLISPTSEFIPQKRSEVVYYTVQKGDTVSTIAQRFDITINTVLWANNLGSHSLIRPGDSLLILPESGIMHTVKSGDTISRIARTYDVEEEKILSSNQLGATLRIGDKIMIPGGRKITVAAATTPVASSASNSSGLGIIRDLVKAPASTAATSGTKMAWPTDGARITQYYSWRHTGLDIANKTGTPLYAAEDGTVEYSGWSNGYGYNVLVDHGDGRKTRYAHASKLFVEVGDSVTRGENIAAMGSTGWSTGPHIHFEVIINGKKQNPLNYIK